MKLRLPGVTQLAMSASRTLRRVVVGAKVSTRQIVLEVTERNELPDLERAAAMVRNYVISTLK